MNDKDSKLLEEAYGRVHPKSRDVDIPDEYWDDFVNADLDKPEYALVKSYDKEEILKLNNNNDYVSYQGSSYGDKNQEVIRPATEEEIEEYNRKEKSYSKAMHDYYHGPGSRGRYFGD